MAKLLMMEDDVVFSFRLKNMLKSAGHQVEVRSSATDAIEELLHESYDVLISDVIIREDGKPVPDGGIKLVSWVRNHEEMKTLPIIVITGSHKYQGMQHILTTARQIGANAGLEKPFDDDEILSLISRLSETTANALHKNALR